MKTFDIDVTLLDYDYLPGSQPKINHALIATIAGETINLVTNQGGLPFGVMGAKRKDGGKVGKVLGLMTGGAVRPRLDRPGRKVGGRVGADKSPLSSANKTTSAEADSSGGKPN